MPSATFNNLSEDKRLRILNAAAKEFAERGVVTANLANIVKDAKIARGSIYSYFSTKEELYVYLFDTLRAQRAEYVQPAFALYRKAPFIDFFSEFYLRDCEYLMAHPIHVEMGKQLYCGKDNTSLGLIRRQQKRYRDWFIVAIEADKDRGLIDQSVSGSVLTDLCVHFVTDVFIFQNIFDELSMENLRQHCDETMRIIREGIRPRAL